MAKKLYFIDGHSQMYRAYFAPFGDLSSPTGEPTRATYVFCSMLLKLIAEKKPDYLAMAIDGPAEKLHRRQMFDDYKVTRKPMPDDLRPQIERIIQIVETMGIPVIEAEGYEADDILATAADKLAGEDLDLVIVSRDKDLDQLLNDHVVLYDPQRDEVIDPQSLLESKGFTPAQAVEIQALTGDTSDNIPGVLGVGPKTAVKLIRQYGSAQAVLDHADEQTPKLAENLRTYADQLRISRKLVKLDRNVPIQLDLESMAYRQISPEIRPIFAELGFGRLLDQLDAKGVGLSESGPVSTAELAEKHQQTAADDFEYACIDTPEKLKDLAGRLSAVNRIAVDTETTSTNPHSCKLVGVSLSWQAGKGFYLPVAGPLGAVTLDLEDVRQAIGPILADQTVEKVGQNFKFDWHVLSNHGFTVAGPIFDTMVAAWVLDSDRLSYKMDALAIEYLNHRCIPIEELIGRGRKQQAMDAVPVEIVSTYAAEDADVTLRLADVLSEQLKSQGLLDLLLDLEMPLLPVLVQMEREGIEVDCDRLRQMQGDLSGRADKLRDRIIELAGEEFNPDSPKQLAEVLFDKLKLPVIKSNKTGPSTDSAVLEELATEHEIPGLVLDYRKLTKLIGTYLKSLAQCVLDRTGRVHTSFHQAGTATGRLSSSDPNLQNIPIRTEEGRQIRSAFVACPGCKLLAADYSQVELRVLAHLCGDETMTEAFRSGQDIHRTVAALVFGVGIDKVDADMRARAKGVNFGIIYGQTAFGLSRALRISRSDAADFIDAYKRRFPKIEQFLEECIAQAKSTGYVETIFKRRRRIADIDSRNGQKRAWAERLAINSVVQGSAADLIKQAMIQIARRIEAENRRSRMLLQIHDELIFEIPEADVDCEQEMIVEEMTGAIELSVPLVVDVGTGATWLEAK